MNLTHAGKFKIRIKIALFFLSAMFLASCSQVPKATTPSEVYHPPAPYSPDSKRYPNIEQRKKVVLSAYQTLGSPYRYGGTTYNGFDCSGLTRHVYHAANLDIPRTAAQQRDRSKTIHSYSNLRPGDLIFFKTGRKTNHVGVFVGKGQFIHASTSKKRVIKTKLDTPYWRRSFVKFGTYIR